MQEIALFSGKIYTAGTNFTRPLVVTVATNINSATLPLAIYLVEILDLLFIVFLKFQKNGISQQVFLLYQF